MAQKVIKRKSRTKAKYDPAHGLQSKVDMVDSGENKNNNNEFFPGDTVKVHCRIKEGEKERIQIFEGTVIGRGNRGGGKTFTVRKLSHGVGVERIFMMNSPVVTKIEVVMSGKVRRSKLYYLRGLEGRAAKIEQDVQTNDSLAASQAAKTTSKAN